MLVPAGAALQARDLTFEERVRAQRAIEHLYYSHQIGETRPFEQAVPRALLEKKVRAYLVESAALQRLWQTPVTAEMLRRESERIARDTRMPERLLELYGALGNDAFLFQETIARASLVDRLARRLFASDPRIHMTARQEAQALRQRLLDGSLNPRANDPHRVVADVILDDGDDAANAPIGRSASVEGQDVLELKLAAGRFQKQRDRAPAKVGEIGPITERRDTLEIRVVLSESAGRFREASYVVNKRSFDDWWPEVSTALDGVSVAPAAASDAALTPPAGVGPERIWSVDSTGQLSGAVSPAAAGTPAFCGADDTWVNGSLDIPDPRELQTALWTGTTMLVWGGTNDTGYLNTGGIYDPLLDHWTAMTNFGAPDGRESHTAVWTGSTMIVWGGYGALRTTQDLDPNGVALNTTDTSGIPKMITTNLLNSGGIYDPLNDFWLPTSTKAPITPKFRDAHTAVWTGSTMIIWGGYDGGATNKGGIFDPNADPNVAWTQTFSAPTLPPHSTPAPRYYHGAVWTGSKMIVWGGSTTTGFLNTGSSYDPSIDQWTDINKTNAPSARDLFSTVWTGTKMIVWGGDNPSGALQDGGRYDPIADSWSPTSLTNGSGAPAGRMSHTAVWTGSKMLVFGGLGPANSNAGASYDPASDSWAALSTTNAPDSRYFHTAVWADGLPTPVMIVYGGEGTDGPLASGGQYDPAHDKWTSSIVTTNAPEGRTRQSTVWTGSQMIVWGGGNSINSVFGVFNTGSRYDPILDTWTATSTGANVPLARQNHTAVWTGSKMVVWGGFSLVFNSGTHGFDPTYLASGAQYDPILDTWTATSTGANVPLARQNHTAVWTGSRMIVWGGINQIGGASAPTSLNTGAAYDPAGDAWTAISTTNAPAPRTQHKAVWTGSKMIVWGGLQTEPTGCNSLYLGNGGIYDPAGNVWSSISTAGAPSPRAQHTAIWTSGLTTPGMIVFGGLLNTRNCDVSPPTSVNTYYGDGARYDPAADSWTALSTSIEPSPRAGQTAIWTGSLMVIFGGFGPTPDAPDGTYALLGGRYDPVLDGWSFVSPVAQPAGRVNHSAVWADGQMVVWGGTNGASLNTGGRYCDCVLKAFYRDADADGHGNPGASIQACGAVAGYVATADDCNDASASVWSTPSETRDLVFVDNATITWTPPASPGATADLYDLIRSDTPGGFQSSGTCVATDTSGTSALDAALPVTGSAFFYLVRAQDACPSGQGSLGTSSNGTPLSARSCP